MSDAREYPPSLATCGATIGQHELPIDEHMTNSLGELCRLLVGGSITHSRRVEDRHIRHHARHEETPVDEPDERGRQTGHLSDRVLPGQPPFLAHISTEHSRKSSVVARMGTGCRRRSTVAGHNRIGELEKLDKVALPAKANDRASVLFFEQPHNRLTCRYLEFFHDLDELSLGCW